MVVDPDNAIDESSGTNNASFYSFAVTSRSAASDFNSDGTSDLLWQNDNGQAAVWSVSGAAQSGGHPGSSWHRVSG